MIRDTEAWEKWERRCKAREPVDIQKNFEIFNLLLKEARALGKIPPPNPLQDLEIDIHYAQVIRRAAPPSSSHR